MDVDGQIVTLEAVEVDLEKVTIEFDDDLGLGEGCFDTKDLAVPYSQLTAGTAVVVETQWVGRRNNIWRIALEDGTVVYNPAP